MLDSVKESIENFINDPLLNPDFSETVVDGTNAPVTDFFQDILDDIDRHLELYDEMDEIIEMHEAFERAELEHLTALHADESDIPDDVFEDRSV